MAGDFPSGKKQTTMSSHQQQQHLQHQQQQHLQQQQQSSTPGMPHPGAVMQPSIHYQQPQPQLPPQMQPQVHYQNIQKQQLQLFWQQQMSEMEQISEFKNHQLPLARIKKIMKSDEDVKMIAAEAPVLFAKACEMFILELTLRSWIHTEENKRRTLQRNDIAGAIKRGDIFDFLVDIVPQDDLKEEDLGVSWSGVGVGVPGEPTVSYAGMYYPPVPQQSMGHHPMPTPEMMVVQSANPQMMYQPPQ